MAVRTRTGGDWTVTSTGDVTGQEIDPLYLLDVSFDDIDTPAQDRVWTDLGERLRSWNAEGGRDSELDELDATKALLVLDTRDRELDPTNDASTLAPNVVPNRRVRLRAQTLNQTFDVFAGYVDGWGPSWLTTNYGDFLARVTATDGRKILSAWPLPAASPDVEEYAEVIASLDPSFYYRMGEPQGTKLVGHKRKIRYKKGEKKGKVKRVKRWKTRETRAATEGVSGPPGTYINSPLLGQPGAIKGDSDTAVQYRSAQSERTIIPVDVNDFRGLSALSVSCWVKVIDYPGFSARFIAGPVNATSNLPVFGLSLIDGGFSFSIQTDAVTPAFAAAHSMSGRPHGIYRHVLGTWDGANVRIYINGVLEDTEPGTSIVNGTDGLIQFAHQNVFVDVVLDEVAIFEKALSGDQAEALYAAAALGFDAAATGERIEEVLALVGEWDEWNIHPGTRTMPPARYAGLEPAQLIAEASEAEGVPSLFFFNRRNVPTLLPADYRDSAPYDAPLYEFGLDAGLISYESVAVSDQDAFLYNIIRVTGEADETTVTVTAEDATSKGRFGERVLDVDGVMLTTTAELQALADTLLARHKDPMVRVTSFTLNGLDPDAREAALTLDIGDRVSVTIQPPGGGDPFVQESFVERRSLTHEEGAPLRATFSVSPR